MDDISVPAAQKNKSRPGFIIRLVATGFFTGYSPLVPGTVGSIIGLMIYAIPGFENTIIIGISIFIFLVIGIFTSHRMEISEGKDPTCVVIDEIVGMWTSLLFIPKTFLLVLCGFMLFRFFDIIKLQPAGYVERFRNGVGVMLDDIIAAIYANATLHLVIWLFPGVSTF